MFQLTGDLGVNEIIKFDETSYKKIQLPTLLSHILKQERQ